MGLQVSVLLRSPHTFRFAKYLSYGERQALALSGLAVLGHLSRRERQATLPCERNWKYVQHRRERGSFPLFTNCLISFDCKKTWGMIQ